MWDTSKVRNNELHINAFLCILSTSSHISYSFDVFYLNGRHTGWSWFYGTHKWKFIDSGGNQITKWTQSPLLAVICSTIWAVRPNGNGVRANNPMNTDYPVLLTIAWKHKHLCQRFCYRNVSSKQNSQFRREARSTNNRNKFDTFPWRSAFVGETAKNYLQKDYTLLQWHLGRPVFRATGRAAPCQT